ncbi:hypothetical protein L9F63_019840 [Diploptera punctata]|uniref:Ionotropic glutamate receptor C-terminal domain-containing protein n=1 Tax=Diploptera punctata TaxID=6984 RepID=A0AAD8EE39_DIPPU|nr:hypothetical protein L9F63_019840 [Diploptera punctata]
MTPEYIDPRNGTLIWGDFFENGGSYGILGDAKENRANISFAGLAKNTDQYEYYLESTVSYQESGFYWFVRCPRDSAQWKGLGKMFTPLNWATLWLVYISSAFLLWILSKRARMYELVEWKNFEKFLNCCQVVLVILLNSSTVRAPRTNLIRVFFLLMMFYGFSFNIIFQTIFTQRLIDPGKEKQVSNLEELVKSDLKITLLQGHEGIFRHPDNLEKEVISKYSSCIDGVEPCAARVANFGDTATVMDNKMFMEMEHKFMDERHESLLCRLSEMIMPYRISMYVTKGLPLLDTIDDIILHAVEAGLLEHWWGIEVAAMRRNAEFHSYRDLISYQVFTLNHLYVAFLLVIIGYLLSIIAFIYEIYYFKHVKRRLRDSSG